MNDRLGDMKLEEEQEEEPDEQRIGREKQEISYMKEVSGERQGRDK